MNQVEERWDGESPRIVTFGGGKGGSGRSTLCSEIARSLGRQGHRVLCVDAHAHAPTLNVFLHAPEPPAQPQHPCLGEEQAHIADFIQETGHRQVWLASVASARRYPFVRLGPLADDLIWQLRQLDFDWIFIDLEPGQDPMTLDLFLRADLPIIAGTPEPATVRASTQFLRATIFRALQRRADAHPERDRLLGLLYAQPMLLGAETLRAMGRRDAIMRELVEDILDHLEIYLIINLVREGAERDLGHVLAHAWHEALGVYPRFLTSVNYEDRRWFYNRRTAGLHTSRGDEALSMDIEKIARNLTEIDDVDARAPRPVPRDGSGHPAERLGLSPRTSGSHLRQHCRRLWEGYRREATVALVFDDPEDRQRMAERLEVIYRKHLTTSSSAPGVDPPGLSSLSEPSLATISSDEIARSGPGARITGRHHDVSVEATRTGPASDDAPFDEGDTPAPFHVRSDQSAGRIITRLRQRHNLSLYELSQRSHIGIKYLTALEDANLEILPRPVYIRGYLREIARIFGVDSDQLIEEYFRLMDA